jgi:PilZ domain
MRFTPAERRRSPRIRLQIPLFLRSVDTSGMEHVDLTKTLDISSTGAFLTSKRFLRAGQSVRITIPVCPEAVSGLVPAETPPIRARVRRIIQTGDLLLAGVEFLKPLE